MIYFDNAATSYPKPESVRKAMYSSFNEYGANPGRSGHNFSVKAAEKVFDTRRNLNDFFNGYGEENTCFTMNCTQALNIAIKGILNKGDHVIISSLEHNSVARPVHSLSEQGIVEYSVFSVTQDKDETINNYKKAFRNNTKLCIVTAVSNVFGDILPIGDLSRIAHENGAFFFVDGAQGAGVVPLDMKKQGIDCLCVPGHKGLLGPMGTGALLHKNLPLKSLFEGGTGTSSFNLSQPEQYPEKLESGTLNVPGICGLNEGINVIKNMGLEKIYAMESYLGKEIFNGLKNVKGVKLYEGFYDQADRAPVISFNIKNCHSEQASFDLNAFGIAVRGGYHCSPLAHISRNTRDTGTIRISPSFTTTKKDINILLNLVEKIAFKYFI